MKRLLGLLGLTCLLVLTACFYLSETAAVILGISALILFIFSMFFSFARKEGTYPVAFITAFIIVCVFLGYTNLFVNPLKAYDGKTADIVAYSEDEYYQNGFYNYVLKVKEIDGEEVNSNLLLCSKFPIITKYHDELHFSSEISFTENKSLWSRKIFFRSYLYEENEVDIINPDRRPLVYHFKEFRKDLSTALYLEMDYDEANFSSAVLLGDKYALTPQVKSLLRDAGLSHIAVVSGLHLSIIAAMCSKLFDKLFRSRSLSGGFTILSILAFSVLSGLGISVIRAGVMLIIYTLGKMIGRRSDSINSIGAAALLLIIINPFCVGDVGMLLSFSATLGIVFWSDKISRPIINKLSPLPFFRLKAVMRILKIIVETLSMSLCASLWTLPITIFVYDGVSTVSLNANLFVVPFMWIVLLAIGLCIITHYIQFLSVMCDWLSGFVSLFYNYLIFVCETVTALPYSFVNTDKPYFYIWLALTLLMIGISLIISKKKMNILTILLSFTVLFVGATNYNIARSKSVTMHIVDAGDGFSVLLESSDGYAVLRAEGSKYKPYVLENKIEKMHSKSQTVYVDVIGENSQVYFDNIVNQFDYDCILMYDNMKESYGIDEEIKDKIIYYSDVHNLSLWSKVNVCLISSESAVSQYITIGDTNILITSEESDLSTVSHEYLHPDILITDGLPDSFELIDCDKVYVSGDSYKAQVTAEILCGMCDDVVGIGDYSFDIEI